MCDDLSTRAGIQNTGRQDGSKRTRQARDPVRAMDSVRNAPQDPMPRQHSKNSGIMQTYCFSQEWPFPLPRQSGGSRSGVSRTIPSAYPGYQPGCRSGVSPSRSRSLPMESRGLSLPPLNSSPRNSQDLRDFSDLPIRHKRHGMTTTEQRRASPTVYRYRGEPERRLSAVRPVAICKMATNVGGLGSRLAP